MADQNSTSFASRVRLIIDHNPFFLLSAICMMFGCHVLNTALYTKAGDIRKLLVLLAVINAYEASLIGLGLFLLRRSGPVRRDAHTLMGLESLFLADTTFISGVIATIDARSGWMLSTALLALCLLKVSVVAGALRLPCGRRIIALVMVQMLVALCVPPAFKQIAMARKGFPPELMVYIAWWAVGLLPVIGAALLWPREGNAEKPAGKSERVLTGIYLVVPFLSAMMHVYGAGWVYNFYLKPPEVSPLLLGFAVALSAMRRRSQPRTILAWQIVLIVSAVACSLPARNSLVFDVAGMHVTPVRLTSLGSALVILHLIWLSSRAGAVVAAALGSVGIALWPHLPAIWATMTRSVRGCGSLLNRLVPQTSLQWGIICVVASFALLGIGAAFSLRRRPPAEPLAEPGPQEPPKTEEPAAEEAVQLTPIDRVN